MKNSYIDFWNSIRQIANGYAGQVTTNDVDVKIENGKLKVQSRPFWITDLPNRRGSPPKEHIDVAITFEQEVIVKETDSQCRYFEAVVSNVRVLYLENYQEVVAKTKKNSNYTGKVLSGFHFDLVNQEKQSLDWYDHPIYHANFDMKCIDLHFLKREGYTLPEWSNRIDYPRIPTAPIDLAGAIFLLLRDHLPELVEKGWPAKIGNNANKLPHYPNGVLRRNTRNGQVLDYLSWYNIGGGRNSIIY